MWFTFHYLWLDFNSRKDVYFERAANIFMFISALLISASPKLSVEAWTFLGFLIGHIIWIIAAVKMKKKTLVEYNVGFLLLDLWAIGVRL